MANRYTFDTAYLRIIAEQRSNTDELTAGIGISRCKLERILSGQTDIRYSEMLSFARILKLTSVEFERCFFMPCSSENLNQF